MPLRPPGRGGQEADPLPLGRAREVPMEKPTYQRVLLKISGEALAGAPGRGIDFAFARQVCQVVQDLSLIHI